MIEISMALSCIFAFIVIIFMVFEFFGINGQKVLVEDLKAKESISAVPPK